MRKVLFRAGRPAEVVEASVPVPGPGQFARMYGGCRGRRRARPDAGSRAVRPGLAPRWSAPSWLRWSCLDGRFMPEKV
jgi:hypothetical protein